MREESGSKCIWGACLNDHILQKACADRAAAERVWRMEQDFHIHSWQPHAFSPHKRAQFLSLLIRFLPIQPDLKKQGIVKCSLSLGTLDAIFPSCHKVPAFQRVTERGAGRWPSPAGQDVGQERTAPPVPHRPLSSPAELSRSPSASPWVIVGSG